MKNKMFKKILAVVTAVAVAATPMSGTAFASENVIVMSEAEQQDSEPVKGASKGAIAEASKGAATEATIEAAAETEDDGADNVLSNTVDPEQSEATLQEDNVQDAQKEMTEQSDNLKESNNLKQSGNLLQSDNLEQSAADQTAGEISSTAISSYDFKDYKLSDDGKSLEYEDQKLLLETAGSGKKPSLANDVYRGQVLQLNEADYNNRGYALLPGNPFAGKDTENGLTVNFWTKTTGKAGGDRCLIDFEVAPSTGKRAGTFAVNQLMAYWNTTDQNTYYTDFSISSLGLDQKDAWKMVTMTVTKSGITFYSDGVKKQHTITSGTERYEQMISDLTGGLAENPSATNVRLGASLATYWKCAGAMLDDVSFYGKALSDDEIAKLYQETMVPIPLERVSITGKNTVDEDKSIRLGITLEPASTNVDKTVTWVSDKPEVLTVDEKGTAKGISEGTAHVTAIVSGVESESFEITVRGVESIRELQEGYYAAVYSTSTDFYASASNVAQETRSVYMAVSKDGKNFDVLNNGGAVIFSKNTSGTLQITDPRIFKTEEGFTVAAPDATLSKGIHLFNSLDGVNYYDDIMVSETELSSLPLKRSNFTLLLNGENILDTDEQITLGNAVSLTEEEYQNIVNKLGTVVNNGLESLTGLNVDAQQGLTEQELEKQYPSVNALYTDGSRQEFSIDWEGALQGINLSQPGEYTITGKVVQTQYVNKLKELNGSSLPEDDPENANPDDPDNYNEETGTVYYDETKFVEGMADPCIYWDEQSGYYYMTGSYFPEDGDQIDGSDQLEQYDRVVLRRAKTLEGLQDRSTQVTVWKAGNQGFYDGENYASRGYRYIWAPEIHRVGDNWVIYFTESHSSNLFDIYCHALVLPGDKDPYETALQSSGQSSEWTDYKLGVTSQVSDNPFSKSFCLDMTYFKDEVNGQSYVIWAGKPTAAYQGSSTDLFIASVDEQQPWLVTSEPTRITCSDYGWERIRYCVNEGATVLQKDGNIFMCYSASGTGSEYAIGMCSAKGGADLLDASNWTKSPYPLLTSRDVNGEEGPGHNSFTVDQDGNAIFVYHARPTSHNYRKCGSDYNGNNSSYNGEPLNDPCRHARLKRVHWAADGSPILKMTYEEELLDAYSTVSLKVTVTKKAEEKVTVEYAAQTGGKISGTAVQTIVKGGSTAEVTAVADTGYSFTGWSDGIKTAKRSDRNVTASKKLTANFTKNQTPPKPPVPNPPVSETPKASRVKLSKTNITIGYKEKVKLKATVIPAKASQQVTWSSSNKSIVKVTSKGEITGRKTGKSTITVKTANGKKSYCKVTVKKAPKTISISPKTKNLKKGKTWKIKVKFPSKTASYKLKYKSYKKSVAVVSSSGKITAKKKGNAKIRVTTFNGKNAYVTIHVR